MIRPLPRSLAGQMALLLGIALLVAQLVNLALILSEREKRSLVQNEGPAIARFAALAADLGGAAPEFRSALVSHASRRGARFALAAASGVAEAERVRTTESALFSALGEAGVRAAAVRAARDEAPSNGADRRRPDMQFLRLAMRRQDGSWLTGRLVTPRRDPWLGARLAAATLALYLIVLGATLWLARRIARPLDDLTRAAERFGGRVEPVVVRPRGPDDLRTAITAFNAMNGRVMTLLDEKDRMLGALGHDLRTPLASLRIRVEAIEDAGEREAAVATIEELSATLEDILVLARSGRAREPARALDLAALVEAVGEDYAAMDRPVSVRAAADRLVATVQPNALRRALRNLIDNAVTYGGNAVLSVEREGATAAIRVADAGPGLPQDEFDRVLEPFYRVEGSRNRETGGSGLGLAIARGIVESHGGRLQLTPNHPAGLIATLFLPL